MAKATGKATPAKKRPARKVVAKKPAAAKKKAAGTRAAARKPVAKKVVAKKPAPKKVVAKKVPARKVVAKKRPATKKPSPPKAAPAKAPKRQPAGKTCPLSGIWVPKQSPSIAARTLEKLQELLLEERERHVRQAADLQADAEALVSEREQGDTQFDEESGEGDTISVERERDLMLSASARQAVEEIDRALLRMESGSYGLCVPAGRRIPVARLEAIPWAESCVDCKQRVERRR